MPVFAPADVTEFSVHGGTFGSYVSSASGSAELCAWRLSVPPGLQGVAHSPDREEVLLLLEGQLRMHLDGVVSELGPGSVALVPAGSELRVDAGPSGATAWVTTRSGLQATLADGSSMRPPWAQ